jgi:ABC-type multidrug transport system fused ATPase/permease subunit
VDRETDKLMQQIIRESFKDCTIITIAHRLETIMDFDRVEVMSGGELVECNAPQELLAKASIQEYV